jgi:hypothetical protein
MDQRLMSVWGGCTCRLVVEVKVKVKVARLSLVLCRWTDCDIS